MHVFHADPHLLAYVQDRHAALLKRQVTVPVLTVERGSQGLNELVASSSGLGVLILDGLILHEISTMGKSGVELLGPGDLVHSDEALPGGSSIESSASWTVLRAARLAVLDEAFEGLAVRVPGVARALLQRAVGRARSKATQIAVSQLRNASWRVWILLWYLADRWGWREPEGTVVPHPLSGRVLGLLASAQRPTVSSALSALRSKGLLRPHASGGWLLLGDPPTSVADLRRHIGEPKLVGVEVPESTARHVARVSAA